MYCWRLASSFLIVNVILLEYSFAALDVNLIETCCVTGSSWATASGGRCESYTREDLAVEGISVADQEQCMALVEVCCVQTVRNGQCGQGQNIARREETCSSLRVHNARTESFIQQKECCLCCQLGKFAAISSRHCQLFERSGDICKKSPHCCEAFYNCCNSTTGSVPVPSTVSPTRGPSSDVEPVHTPGGMCERYSSVLCEHRCHDAPDRPNKFYCSCRQGFELSPNVRNCVPTVNSPTCESNNPCQPSAECYMKNGIPTCRCTSDGYRLISASSCEDVNECLQGLDNCSPNDKCENTDGGFKCTRVACPNGTIYSSIMASCVSSSISSEGEGRPSRIACGSGQIYDHRLRTCVSARPVHGDCPQGYVVNIDNGFCEDIDECALGEDDCQDGQRCENTLGSFSCRRSFSCGTGYTLQESTQICVDINECILGTHNCGSAFECRNTPGSFRCEYKICAGGLRLNSATGKCEGGDQGDVSCTRGYRYDDIEKRCTDVDECLGRSPCPSSDRCVNTEGSYRCQPQNRLTCYQGTELNAQGNSCVDINECERGLHNCESTAQCQNTQGGFRCRCSAGYQWSSASNSCEDMNECNPSHGQVCSAMTSTCVNVPGSFYCQCKDGFEANANSRTCQDINECLIPNICQHSCQNVWGSYQCRCRPGFRLADDKRQCIDVNECELSETRGRLCNGFCENVPGSFRCTCPAGFKLSDSGRECLDTDECTDGLADCNGPNQVCINTRGSFKCNVVTCPRYFALASDNLSRNSLRCARQAFVCPQGDSECLTAPLSLSYNFLTLRATRLRIPTELFTMRGPDSFPRIEFNLAVKSVENLARDSSPVTRENFSLRVDPAQLNVAVVSIVLPIQGKQDIVLNLDMTLYNEKGFFGTATAIITIYATADPWEDAF